MAPLITVRSSSHGGDQDIPGASNLADREALHRSLVASSPTPVMLVDLVERRVLEANPALESLLGYLPGELMWKLVKEIQGSPPYDLEGSLDHVGEVHHDLLGERHLVRQDGSAVAVEASGNLLVFRGRRVVAVYFRDITARKMADQERARLEKQLLFAQRHEAVGRLAGGIAHDFNNLVTTITLSAEMGEYDPSTLKEGLADILDACGRARDLTRQLLAFSGKQDLKPRRSSLNAVVHGLQRLLRRTIGEDVELTLSLDDDIGDVQIDHSQIDQVILNLVVNAVDAMPEGGSIVIGTGSHMVSEEFARPFASIKSGPHVLLTVSDTGSGMDAETQRRIFEPFFTTKERGKGTGLGLSTVYGIVKQSGGHIWVTSTPGHGTTFSIYFPLVPDGGELGAVEVAPMSEAIVGGGERILLVEDDDPLRRRVAAILQQLGYDVVPCARPTQALQRVMEDHRDEKGFDLVLTDVVMPEMTGIEMVRRIHEAGFRIPVLYMSGYSADRDGRLQAPQPLLRKPCTRQQIASSVRMMLGQAVAS